ncbi:MAG TPA: c-type cytochrome [Candidatus Baltobacteraceae bacterium]|nr:c-type cytochrome [Candidatus Baltobacteraceae bacterium]
MMIAVIAAMLLMQTSTVPSSGNVLATPQPARTTDPYFAVHPSSQDLHEGERLFDIRCTSCHGMNLQGTDQGPPLIGIDIQDVDFELRTGRMPAPVPFEQEMHKMPYFPPQQVRDIVSYVMSKSNGDKVLPTVTLRSDAQSVKSGRDVYEENCEQCHAATGFGNSVDYRDVAPSLMEATPQDLADAVRYGPDVMPRFGPSVINQRHLDDLASYVWYLQHGQYNPGGLQLANWGPVSEGFVAWTFGIGLLVLLARRIGSIE